MSLFHTIGDIASSAVKKASDALTGHHDDPDKKDPPEKKDEPTAGTTAAAGQHAEGDHSIPSGTGQDTPHDAMVAEAYHDHSGLAGFREDWHLYYQGKVDAPGLVLTDNGKPVDPNAKPPEIKNVATPTSGDSLDYEYWNTRYEQQKTGDPAAVSQPPETEKPFSEKVVSWLGDRWDRWFGGGKAGQYETTDANGVKHTTTMSDNGVDHHTSDGTDTHVDSRGSVSRTKEGDTRYVNKEHGTTGVELHTKAKAERQPDGSFIMKDDRGHELKISKEGDITGEVNGHPIKVDHTKIKQRINGVDFEQHRHGDGGTGEQAAEASAPTTNHDVKVTAVTDPEDGTRMLIANDGHGNLLKVRTNGERILSSADNPGVELISKKDDPAVKMRVNGEEYYLRRQAGGDNEDRWYLYKSKDGGTEDVFGWVDKEGKVWSYNQDDKTQVGAQVGQIKGLNQETGELENGAGAIGTNGEIRTTGQASKVKVTDANGLAVDGKDGPAELRATADGDSSVLIHKGPDGKADVTTVNATNGKYEIKDFDPAKGDGEPQFDSNGNCINGHVQYRVNGQDAQGNDIVEVNAGDTDGDGKPDFMKWGMTDDGPAVVMPNGDVIDPFGNMIGFDGTRLNYDGSARFSDGTEVDEYGNVTHNGDYMGESGGFEDDGAASARVGQILAVAESLRSSASYDPGKVAFLMSLFDALGASQGLALQNNDIGGFIQADLAKAVVSGAISQAQAAEARIQIGQSLAGHPLDGDQIAEVQNKLSGVSPEVVRKFMEDNHWTAASQSPEPALAGRPN